MTSKFVGKITIKNPTPLEISGDIVVIHSEYLPKKKNLEPLIVIGSLHIVLGKQK